MNGLSANRTRILAIDPTTKGFGFAVLEGPEFLVDWGTKETPDDKRAHCLKLVGGLIKRYGPDVIVTENPSDKDSRRCQRVQELIAAIIALARERACRTRSFTRADVHTAFSDVDKPNKHRIANAIAEQFPELAPRLPPFRKPWMSEDARMSIFDATALALTFYRVEQERNEPARLNDNEWESMLNDLTKI